MDVIASNLHRLRDALASAARESGRQPEDIRLIAVSKTHSVSAIASAVAAGQRLFGESTTQEALTKIPHFADQGLEWHFIGHLQSNKAKFLPGNFSWLHSLDSVKLAQRIGRFAEERGTTINTLVEVNVTGDPNKHGILPTDVCALLDTLQRDRPAGILLRGLMTIGPYPASESDIRHVYASLRELRETCAQRSGLTDFTELSMGMSSDYLLAIKEGATMVRVGTSIFGERDYDTQ